MSAVENQYSLKKILSIWAGVSLPMGGILWVVTPLLIPHVSVNPNILYFLLITLGLVWQGVFAYLILKKELDTFTWENLKERLWLNTPIDPVKKTASARLFLWTIPLIVFALLWDNFEVLGNLNEIWIEVFPFFSPPDYGLIHNLAEPAKGQWWLLGPLFILIIFNYFIGEELIFRGILLPKMNGVFGRWDWVANGVLFATYHIHMIWLLPSTIIVRDWIYPWAAKRYKSYWVAVVIHGFDIIPLVFLFTLAIMGKLEI